MPDLRIEVTGAEAPRYSAVPTLIFEMRLDNAPAEERVHSIALRCQIQIAATRRRYTPQAQARLLEVFGEPQRWRETLRPLLWTHAGTVVPSFTESATVELPVPCTYDFEVVGTKYFDAVEEGEIPLTFLFSGTVFYEGTAGQLQVAQVPWDLEAAFRLPVALWREMIARFYPNSAWIRLQKDVFDRLYRYKAAHALPTWEDALARLIQASGEEVRP